MSYQLSIALALHGVGAVIWVGGMFFAHMALRPSAMSVLEPPLRLSLWNETFSRFFQWVWAAIFLLFTTGFWVIYGFYGGMGGVRSHIHAMLGSGTIMAVLFAYLYFVPYSRMRQAVSKQDWPEAGRNQNRIRIIVTVNLIIGLVTTILGTSGRYLAA